MNLVRIHLRISGYQHMTRHEKYLHNVNTRLWLEKPVWYIIGGGKHENHTWADAIPV